MLKKCKFENSNLADLVPYTLSSQKAWQYLDQPELLKLDWNESTHSPSPNVAAKLAEYLQNGKLNYYPITYSKSFTEKLARYCRTEVENILYFASSDSAHEYIVRAFAETNDKLLIVGPTYDNFRVVAQSAGMKFGYCELSADNKFAPCVETLSDAINEFGSPKIVYICNPNNPTGTVWSKNQINELLTTHPNVLFILDEAYFEFGGESCTPLVQSHDNLIVTRTFSKAFGLAGVRVGYTVASQTLNNSIQKIRNTKSVGTLAIVAAEAALDDVSYTKNYVEKVIESKKDFMNFLSEIDVPYFGSEAGNFLMMQPRSKVELISAGEKQKIFIRDLAHLSHIGNFVRISIGTQDEMLRVKNLLRATN